jgi:hypothetical protein
VFQRGGPRPVRECVYGRVWEAARREALTEAEAHSPLARRPYDLRYACLSTWLNAGVGVPVRNVSPGANEHDQERWAAGCQ